MASTIANGIEEKEESHVSSVVMVDNSHYRGRVRTGCLVCRARKIKCDEQRPNCKKCTKSKKTCIWMKKTNDHHRSAILTKPNGGSTPQTSQGGIDHGTQTPTYHEPAEDVSLVDDFPALDPSPISSLNYETEHSLEQLLSPAHTVTSSSNQVGYIPSYISSATNRDGTDTLDSRPVLSSMISEDIYLTTTIDLLEATDRSQPAYSYFLEEVTCPFVTPYDHLNWKRMQVYVSELGSRNEVVSAAISSLEALYKAQTHGLSTAHAMSRYRTARSAFERTLDESSQDFSVILITAFLLSLFEIIIPDETCSIFSHSEGSFMMRFQEWALNGYTSPLCLRISAWLRILHVSARRQGNSGLLSQPIFEILSGQSTDPPSLSMLNGDSAEAETSLYDFVSAPIFSFYLGLVDISTRVTSLSHYYRSRVLSADQEEVSEVIAHLKQKLYMLWDSRPTPMKFDPVTIRGQFSSAVAKPLISLIGICSAQYYAEIIEIGRTLSDPQLASEEAKEAICQIRNIIDSGEWNVNLNGVDTGYLNVGYLRPLFMCALESMDRDDVQWAVERLREIHHSICRSDFFAAFADALAQMQMSVGRRITSRFFCFQKFSAPPPFI